MKIRPDITPGPLSDVVSGGDRVISPDDRVTPNTGFPIVGIGASAGGLEAFTQVLKHLPSDTGMAFVLIQHLDPTHPSYLREALAKATTMTVSQAENGARVQPNHVYVIPPNVDLGILHGTLTLSPRSSDVRAPHLPVDAFLRALAMEQGSHAIGVVLSGTACDGTEGLRAIKARDGITFAQDPRSAKSDGMPQSAVDAGVVDYCLPLPELAAELARLSHHPYIVAIGSQAPTSDEGTLNRIFALVKESAGVDFGEYKPGTLHRRLARRVALKRLDGLSDYLTLLEKEPQEVKALCEDILIHVTCFFRDPEVFQILKIRVFPELLKHKPEGAPIRIWVAGCSTGQEVYSLAMTLHEAMERAGRRHPVQFFGSDLSEKAIEIARHGVYADALMRDVSEERRKRYFTKGDKGYRINESVRGLCLFARHDLAQDPPFSKVDLVSCRNVLIYFDQVLQKRLLPTFHYSLNQPGFLLLGRTESISGFTQLFSAADDTHKIFARSAAASALRFPRRSEVQSPAVTPVSQEPEGDRRNPLSERRSSDYSQRSVDMGSHLARLLLARYSPPGALVNEHMDILQFCGQTGDYLQPAPGQPQNNLVSMARGGKLLSALRTTMEQAKRKMAPARTAGVEIVDDTSTRVCDVVVIPFTGLPDVKEPLFVVLFEASREAVTRKTSGKATLRSSETSRAAQIVPKLEHELAATKEYLQSLMEAHGRTNDALGSANDGLVSGNEELQSMNEELETAKEELQSTNEELSTVNEELHNRNQEASLMNAELVSILSTVDFPILILDRERCVRRFTPRAGDLLNLLPSDVGRPLDNIKPNIQASDLDGQIAKVIQTTMMMESEVQDREGHWFRMQIRPCETADKQIDGAILSFVDIDALKLNVSEARLAEGAAEQANRAKDQFLATLSHELRTPLSTMLMHAQLLRRGEVDAARVRRAGDAIERGTKMQVQLIDDLLDVSRIVTGKMQIAMQTVNLSAVIQAALDAVDAPAEAKAIKVTLALPEAPGMVRGDPTRLQQVIWNLLTNAIKFTPQGGRIALALELVDGRACVSVTDTGMGIDPGFLPHVFDRFTQENSSHTRAYGGLGLGLALVRHLVVLHSGAVKAESAGAGQGSTFTVTLPLVTISADSPDASGPVIVRQPWDGLRRAAGDFGLLGDVRILVVDDDRASRETVAEMLSRTGAQVRTAESASEAMATFETFRPKLLVCDIAMPGEDGYAFMRRIRGLGPAAGGKIPALALTALASEEDRREALSAGFQMHLAKPVDIDRLMEAVVQLSEGV